VKTVRRAQSLFGLLGLFALLLGTFFLLASAGRGLPPLKAKYIVYVGTYTVKTTSKGIYAFDFDATTGKLTPMGLVAETTNPSFLALHPNGRFLYAVNEVGDYQGQKSGAVSAFAIDPASGKLTLLNQVATRGADPCYISLDKTGNHVLVANYNGGSVIVFPVLADGRLGEATTFIQHEGHSVNPQRQQGPHAHMIETSPDGRFALAADLGLDELLVYRYDAAKGTLAPNDPPYAKVTPGAGPRHFAFDPSGRFVYLLNEMETSVTAFSYEATSGVLRELQTESMLLKDAWARNTSAEIAVHPSGRFLYASNRGYENIAIFAIAPQKGTLTYVEQVSSQGEVPRNFAIDPTGSYLLAANQGSNNLVVFRIDTASGNLTPTGQELAIPSPVCIVFRAEGETR
jgi:6-phosphogluconolactonase